MDDCLLGEIERAKERSEDLTPYLKRLEHCRWDHDVATCEICRRDGVLPAQQCVLEAYNTGIRS